MVDDAGEVGRSQVMHSLGGQGIELRFYYAHGKRIEAKLYKEEHREWMKDV